MDRVFGVDLAAVDAFARTHARRVADVWTEATELAGDRYVVIAVDTAGGGRQSDEAFAIFLVGGSEFALFTGRIAAGHDVRVPFSTVPLVFVLSLMETIRALHRMLAAQGFGGPLPPVLVVVESNYAYGAALYLQLLRLVRQRRLRHRELRNADIVIATPVYGEDRRRMQLTDARDNVRRELETVALPAMARLRERVGEVWSQRGPRRHGLNQQAILQSVLQASASASEATPVAAQAEAVRRAVLAAWQRIEPDLGEDQFRAVWATEFAATVRAHLEAKQRVADLRARLARLNRQLAPNADADAEASADGYGAMAPGPHAYATIQPFPAGVRLGGPDAAGNEDPLRVDYPAGLFWDAGKRAFGEWTTAAEKVRAFRHFVHIMRGGSSRPMRVIAPPGALLPPPPNARSACDPDASGVRLPPGPVPDLARADVVLRCVWDQWRQLDVTLGGPDGQQVLRVQGKQAEEGTATAAAAVAHDDLWMAFSIGLQWCTRFTRLLANADHRRRQVTYMRRVQAEAEHAVTLSLQAVQDDDDDGRGARHGPADGPTGVDDDEDDAISNRREVPPLPDAAYDALVVIGALLSALITAAGECASLVRAMVLACAVHGRAPDPQSGFRLRVRRVRRPRRGADAAVAHVFEERVAAEMWRAGFRSADDFAQLRAEFGRLVRTVRYACGSVPGPRYAWPGTTATAGGGKREREGADPADRMTELRQRLRTLHRLTIAGVSLHGPAHPVLGAGEPAAGVLELTVRRLRGLLADVTDAWPNLDRDERRTCARYDIPELNRRVYAGGDPRFRSATAADAPPDAGAATTPAVLLLVYGQLLDHASFLRRMAAYNRRRLLEAVATVQITAELAAENAANPNRNTSVVWERAVVGLAMVAPDVRCRIYERQSVPWRHVYRTLWPDGFHRWAADGDAAEDDDAGADTVSVYQSVLQAVHVDFNP